MTEAAGARPETVTLNAPFWLHSVSAANGERVHTKARPAFASEQSISAFFIFVWLVREQQVALGKPDSTPELTVTAKRRETDE